MAMKIATYEMLPTAAARNAGPALDGLLAISAASAAAGAIVTRATNEPASQRPLVICQNGAGDSQVK